MKITHTNIFVNDQDRALKFYTEVLGFLKKEDVPIGEFKWLTVVPDTNPNGIELLLEPNSNPIAKTYQQGLFNQNIPAASFGVENVQTEYERLKALKVEFAMPPTKIKDITVATFDDTCGNLIQIRQL